jgi:hypothetical protein
LVEEGGGDYDVDDPACVACMLSQRLAAREDADAGCPRPCLLALAEACAAANLLLEPSADRERERARLLAARHRALDR